MVRDLEEYEMNVAVQYLRIDPAECQCDTGIDLVLRPKDGVTAGVILAVAYDEIVVQGLATLQCFERDVRMFFDITRWFPLYESDSRI